MHLPGTSRLAVVQADHNAYNVSERAILDEQLRAAEAAMTEAAGGGGSGVEARRRWTRTAEPGEEEGEEPPPRLIGPTPPAAGKGSCVSVVEPSADEPGRLSRRRASTSTTTRPR